VDARRALLEHLIDDAGLFPPARLPMRAALAAHASARDGEFEWILGRFLCPASRSAELLEELPAGLSPLRVGVIADGGDVVVDDRLVIETYEAKWPARGPVPPGATAYVEAGDSTDLDAVVAVIDEAAGRGIGAKLRCGGDDDSMYPSPDVVAAFLARAVELGVGCKATAGLHHPLRRGRAHGFLQLVGAVALLHAKAIEPDDVVAVVADHDADAFALDDSSFRWRGRSADAAAIAAARTTTFHAYGSCSFAEPIDDLRALGIL
jgi:hypothetical protein